MSGETETPGSKENQSRWSWLKKFSKKPERETLGFPEKGKVDMEYFLQLCSTGIAPELRSGPGEEVAITDWLGNSISVDGTDARAIVDSLPLYQMLDQKKAEVEENLEGLLPVISVSVSKKRKGHASGLPMVVEVVEQPTDKRIFKLWSVMGSGAAVEEFNTITEDELKKNYPSIHPVIGINQKEGDNSSVS